ncbi:monooxygenase [Coemansia sp. RSA 2618]|nr:monooxygenase [Coemansia sp. RSA 2618]
MQFPDMAFADTASEFPTRSQVLEYLEEYARTKVLVHPFDLRLNTDVEDVAFDAARNVWTCQTRDLRTDVAQTLEFDAILVCTGRVSYPFIPDVPGLHELAAQRPSLVVHAKEYRRPHDYAGQCVLVVGGASSATDISRQLSFVAREVHISTADDSLADTAARDPRMNPLIGDACDPQRPLIQHPRIAEFSSTHVMFADGTEIPVPDSIIYATGYICAFPFLRHVERLVHAPDPGLPFTADGDGVADMYRFLLYAVNPLLAILGVPNKVVPFVLYEYQATYLAHLYQGHITLPPFAQMLSQARDAQELPRPFTMGFKQIAYLNDLIDCVGDRQSRLGHIPPCWGDRWKQTLKLRKDFLGY